MWTEIKRIDSAEGNVAKFVFTKANAVVEAVLYRYPTYEDRTVICCSTQSGCPVGCRFCGTGEYFVRNLDAKEIVTQVEHCLDQTGVDPATIKKLQIMVMSMGEPLLNLRALRQAFGMLHSRYPHARLLISTIGPDIDYSDVHHLAAFIPTVGLQFSVHQSTDERRNALIPFKKKLDLYGIAREGREFLRHTGRKPFFNYCAGPDNTTEEDADRLARIFYPGDWCATVSVICERNEGMPARNAYQMELAQTFSEKLVARGYDVRVFDPAGQDDIGGGCGQLWFVQDWMRQNPHLTVHSAGYGQDQIHTPAVG